MSPRDAALEFVAAYLKESNGVSPTFRQIGSAIGINSLSHVSRIMSALEAEGKIVRLKRRARALQVTCKDVRLPEIGPIPPAVRRHCPTGKIR